MLHAAMMRVRRERDIRDVTETLSQNFDRILILIAEWTSYYTALPLPVLGEDVDHHNAVLLRHGLCVLIVGPLNLTHEIL